MEHSSCAGGWLWCMGLACVDYGCGGNWRCSTGIYVVTGRLISPIDMVILRDILDKMFSTSLVGGCGLMQKVYWSGARRMVVKKGLGDRSILKVDIWRTTAQEIAGKGTGGLLE